MPNENQDREPDSQPGLRTPRAGAVTEEQRALSPIAMEITVVGGRLQSLAAKLDEATIAGGFAGLYFDLCEECDDIRGALAALKAKLRERAKAEVARQERRAPP